MSVFAVFSGLVFQFANMDACIAGPSPNDFDLVYQNIPAEEVYLAIGGVPDQPKQDYTCIDANSGDAIDVNFKRSNAPVYSHLTTEQVALKIKKDPSTVTVHSFQDAHVEYVTKQAAESQKKFMEEKAANDQIEAERQAQADYEKRTDENKNLPTKYYGLMFRGQYLVNTARYASLENCKKSDLSVFSGVIQEGFNSLNTGKLTSFSYYCLDMETHIATFIAGSGLPVMGQEFKYRDGMFVYQQ